MWPGGRTMPRSGLEDVYTEKQYRSSAVKHKSVPESAVSHLSRRLTVQSKDLTQFLLTNGFRFVDLVAEDQDGHISNGFICH